MSTDCCLCGSFCAVDTWYLSWLFKPPGSYTTVQDTPQVGCCFIWHMGHEMQWPTWALALPVSGLMLLSCHPHGIPFKCPLTNSHHRHVHYRVEHPLRASWISLLFPFQVTKNERQVMKPLYDRYRLVKQILSRANSIPIIVSKAFLWGLFLWFWAQVTGSTTLLHTTQSLRPRPNLPYLSKTKQMSESMTHCILRSGRAGQGTPVSTHEPRGTSHLVLFLLFPLGCCCYFIILCLAAASLPFSYQFTLSCRSSIL